MRKPQSWQECLFHKKALRKKSKCEIFIDYSTCFFVLQLALKIIPNAII